MIRFYPLKTKHGWVVAASFIDVDDDPTVFTEKGAIDAAKQLNRAEIKLHRSNP